jgi:L-rhamnose mutarotase
MMTTKGINMPRKIFFGVMLIGLGVLMGFGRPEHAVHRVGMVIGIKPETIPAYKALHADSNPGVRDLLSKYHMRNFSIFLRELDGGKTYLFGYYEYDGTDYDGDMKRLAAEQRNKAWLAVTDKMQLPLPGQSGWTVMEQVYYNK